MWQEFLCFFVVNAAYEFGSCMNQEKRRAYQWKYDQATLNDFLVKENRWAGVSEYRKDISEATMLTMKGDQALTTENVDDKGRSMRASMNHFIADNQHLLKFKILKKVKADEDKTVTTGDVELEEPSGSSEDDLLQTIRKELYIKKLVAKEKKKT